MFICQNATIALQVHEVGDFEAQNYLLALKLMLRTRTLFNY
jgi:hypothetical protein